MNECTLPQLSDSSCDELHGETDQVIFRAVSSKLLWFLHTKRMVRMIVLLTQFSPIGSDGSHNTEALVHALLRETSLDRYSHCLVWQRGANKCQSESTTFESFVFAQEETLFGAMLLVYVIDQSRKNYYSPVCERLFSKVGSLVSKRQNGLHPNMINKTSLSQ